MQANGLAIEAKLPPGWPKWSHNFLATPAKAIMDRRPEADRNVKFSLFPFDRNLINKLVLYATDDFH
jgi:hypothetical protein